MPPYNDLPKTYDASSVEDGIYTAWEKSGAFQPQGDGEPYCIVMPPPNRTGTLHMGHATMLAIEDLMIRFHRLRGKRTLWIPGTDHAAIATQVKVEQELIKKGMKNPRVELGREKFLEEVVAFAALSRDTIVKQVRKMGSSCDWTQEKYTLDEERNRAVNLVFKMMFEDGIIERGYRVVNWDPQFQTTLSDDEVLTKETTAKLLTFKYAHDFPIAISTTRPETKFGDTAVAVHPGDERYKQFVGQTFTPIFCGKQLRIKVIADEAVDPAFGTGALGVTPAHSMIDAEMAERHSLPTVPVIGKDARLLAEVGKDFAGLFVKEARLKIEERLLAEGLLEKSEEIAQNLPIAERGGFPVEQLPMKQWFIRVNKQFALRQDTLGKWKKGEPVTLKELMRFAVESKQTSIVPERFEKIYFHWIDNLRDWCISRQIWFGHRIPVWYRVSPGAPPSLRAESDEARQSLEDEFGVQKIAASQTPRDDEKEMVVSTTSPGDGWEQDSDTLDTWFSSGLWTFSTLGWPDENKWKQNRAFHPTAVLETGYDILFFWVARMVLMSSYVLGEVPFKDAYLHGLVRDEKGRKMSKSLGNIIDPLDVIPKYGTDAVRLSLVMGTTPGQDMRLSEEKIQGFRNFTNKLWNISRFILSVIPAEGHAAELSRSPGIQPIPSESVHSLSDHWILSRLSDVTASVTRKIEKYEFSSAGEELRDFTWSDLADWYLEISKIEKDKSHILVHILKTILPLWHPFMPFVTEHVWGLLNEQTLLISSVWPSVEYVGDPSVRETFDDLREAVTALRRLRADNGIEPAKPISAVIVGAEKLRDQLEILKVLARAEIEFAEAIPEGWVSSALRQGMTAINVAGAIDKNVEVAKLKKELEQTEAYVSSVAAKLLSADFISKAPAQVVAQLRAKKEDGDQKIKTLRERLERI